MYTMCNRYQEMLYRLICSPQNGQFISMPVAAMVVKSLPGRHKDPSHANIGLFKSESAKEAPGRTDDI